MLHHKTLVLLLVVFATTKGEFQCPSDAIDNFYPDPEQCDVFYRCVNGQQFRFSCGPGTHFNPSINGCDWPHSADCARRKAENSESRGFQQLGPSQANSNLQVDPRQAGYPRSQVDTYPSSNLNVEPSNRNQENFPQPDQNRPVGQAGQFNGDSLPVRNTHQDPSGSQAYWPPSPNQRNEARPEDAGYYPEYSYPAGSEHQSQTEPSPYQTPTDGQYQRPVVNPDRRGDRYSDPKRLNPSRTQNRVSENELSGRRRPADKVQSPANSNDQQQSRKWTSPQVDDGSEIKWTPINGNDQEENPRAADRLKERRYERPPESNAQDSQPDQRPSNRQEFGKRIHSASPYVDGNNRRTENAGNSPNRFQTPPSSTSQRQVEDDLRSQESAAPIDDGEKYSDSNRDWPQRLDSRGQVHQRPVKKPAEKAERTGNGQRIYNPNFSQPGRSESSNQAASDDEQVVLTSRNQNPPRKGAKTQQHLETSENQDADRSLKDAATRTPWYRPTLPPPPDKKPTRQDVYSSDTQDNSYESVSPYYNRRYDSKSPVPSRRQVLRPIDRRQGDVSVSTGSYTPPIKDSKSSAWKNQLNNQDDPNEPEPIDGEEDLQHDAQASDEQLEYPSEEERAKVINELYENDPYTVKDLMEKLPCNETTIKDCEKCETLKWLKFGKVALDSGIAETIISSPKQIVKDCFRRCERIRCVAYTYNIRNGQCHLFFGPVSVDDVVANEDSVSVIKEPKSTLVADEWLFTSNSQPIGKDLGSFESPSSIKCLRACITVGERCKTIAYEASSKRCRLFDSINGEKLALKQGSVTLQHRSIHESGDSWRFSMVASKRLENSLPVTSLAIQDDQECFEECLQTENCISVSIEGKSTKECHIYDQISPFVDDVEFHSYVLKVPRNSSLFLPLPNLYFYGDFIAKEESIEENECQDLAKSVQFAEKITYVKETKECYIFSDSAKIAVWKNAEATVKSSLVNLPDDWRYLAFKRMTGITLASALVRKEVRLTNEKSALPCLQQCLNTNCSAVSVTYSQDERSIECTFLKDEEIRKSPRFIFKPDADLFTRILPENLLPESKEDQAESDHCSKRIYMPNSDENLAYFEKETTEKGNNGTQDDDLLETRSAHSFNPQILQDYPEWQGDLIPHGNQFLGMIEEESSEPKKVRENRYPRQKRSVYAMTIHGASTFDQSKDPLDAGAEAGEAIRGLMSGSLGAAENRTESTLLRHFMERVSEETRNPKAKEDFVEQMKSVARKLRDPETEAESSKRKACKITRGPNTRLSKCRSNEVCEKVPQIMHGNEKALNDCVDTRINSSCTVACNLGYKASREKITCQQIGKNGMWNTEGVFCEKDDNICSELPWIMFSSRGEKDAEKTDYMLKYDTERKLAIFGVYRYGIDQKEVANISARNGPVESDDIVTLPCIQLKNKQLSHMNYKLSEYTKGHIVPPDALGSNREMGNYFVNTAPQDRFTSSGPWKVLESKLSDHFTNQTGFIVSGVCSAQILQPSTSMLPVPKCFWKIACTKMPNGEVTAATFYHENSIPTDQEAQRKRVEDVMSYTNQEFVKSLIGAREFDSIWPEVLDRFSTSKSKTVNDEMMIIKCAAAKKLESPHIEFWNDLLTSSETYSPWSEGSEENDLHAAASENAPVARVAKCDQKIVAHVGLNQSDFEAQAIASILTHVILNSVVKIAPNGSLEIGNDTKNTYDRLYSMKKAKGVNKNLKVLIGLGGWENSQHFSKIAKSSKHQKTFIMDLLSFLTYWDLDGVDIIWQYPVIGGATQGSPHDRENMVKLLRNIKEALLEHQMRSGQKKAHLLVLEGAGAYWILEKGYYLQRIIQYVDWINVMAFDFFGPWNSSWGQYTGPHAPLYFGAPDGFPGKLNVDATIKRYVCQSNHPEKIVLGLGFFGRYWKNVGKRVEETESGDDLFRKATPLRQGKRGGLLSYGQIKKDWLAKSQTRIHNQTRTAFIWDRTKRTLISYENAETILEKVKYAKQKGLGGLMIWSLDMDDEVGTLTKTIRDNYRCSGDARQTVDAFKCAPLRNEKRWWTQYDGDGSKDRMCGKRAPLIDGKYAICDPDDPGYSCCSASGFCGNGPEFCECEGCVDFGRDPEKTLNESTSPSTPIQWYTMDMGLNDIKPHCGPNANPLPDGTVPICNPDDPKKHCCSALGFCGSGPDHCECHGCTNYANSSVNHTKNWFTWSDGLQNAGRCGPTAPRLDGRVAGCDGSSPLAHCCGSNGYCGSGPDYCDCPKCVNFKKNPYFDWS